MIALVLALAAARIPSVAEAERAFAAQAQREGQWQAFLAWADPEAVMFAPEMVKAHEFLAGRKDPPVKVMWWPALTVTSCDGTLAVSTGPWTIGGKAHGTFTTIWRYGPDGWKWLYDSGRETPEAVPAPEKIGDIKAICPTPTRHPDEGEIDIMSTVSGLSVAPASRRLIIQYDNAMPHIGAVDRLPVKRVTYLRAGESKDRSFRWRVESLADGARGAHLLRVWRWNGQDHELVLAEIAGVKPPSTP